MISANCLQEKLDISSIIISDLCYPLPLPLPLPLNLLAIEDIEFYPEEFLQFMNSSFLYTNGYKILGEQIFLA